MKKYLSVVALLFTICVFVLAGCTTPLTKISQDAVATSNGGSVVFVDNYTYFANGFKSYGDLVAGDNKTGAVSAEALVRVKSVNGELEKDEDGNLKTEVVVKKIAGYEYTSIVVYKGYLYFTSPNIHVPKQANATAFDQVTIFQALSDGSNLKEIYTTANTTPTIKYYNVSGKDYMFVLDGTKLYRFTLGTTVKKVLLAEDAKQFVLDEVCPSEIAYIAREETLVYNDDNVTKKVSCITKLNVVTGEKTDYTQVAGADFGLKMLCNNVLYYTKSVNGSDAYMYAGNFTAGVSNDNIQIYSTSVTQLFAFGKNNLNENLPYAYLLEGALYLKTLDADAQKLADSSNDCGEVTNLLLVGGDYLYFSTAKGIYRISYKDKIIQTVQEVTDFKTSNVDFDGRYFYYLSKDADNTTGNYYMLRKDTYFLNKTAERLSIVDKADIKEEAEEE